MRIYLASLNSGMNNEVRKKVFSKCKTKYALETFFNGEKSCKKTLDFVGNENFLLDSGAFSYMNGAKATLNQMQEYVNKYIEFINKYNVKYFFEIDVDNIFGIKQVEKWRRQIETETNKKCIPVWHKGRGVDYWKRMCEDYNYIAIGGLVFHVKKQEYNLIRKLVNYAYKKGVKVHGLGFTKTNELDRYKFFSVDSASWVRGAALGQQKHTFVYDHIESKKLNANGRKTNIPHLAGYNYIEWCKYQKFMEGKNEKDKC